MCRSLVRQGKPKCFHLRTPLGIYVAADASLFQDKGALHLVTCTHLLLSCLAPWHQALCDQAYYCSYKCVQQSLSVINSGTSKDNRQNCFLLSFCLSNLFAWGIPELIWFRTSTVVLFPMSTWHFFRCERPPRQVA